MTPRGQMAARGCFLVVVAAATVAGLRWCDGEPAPGPAGQLAEVSDTKPEHDRSLATARSELVSLQREWADLQGPCERAREDAGLDVEFFRRQYGDFVVAGIDQALDQIKQGLGSVDEPFRINYPDGAWVDAVTVDATIGAARALAGQCPQLFGGWLPSWGEPGRWR